MAGGTPRRPTSTSRMTGGTEKTIAATMAVNRPTSKSTNAGHDVHERGHRLHRVEDRSEDTCANPSLRDEAIPSTRPRTNVTSVAMSTWTSVSIECCQSPIARMATRQATATTACRTPLARRVRPATTPITSHQGDSVKMVWSGLMM